MDEKKIRWTTNSMDDTKLFDAQKYDKDFMFFLASQGSQISNIMELLAMDKKIHDKLITIGVAQPISMSTNQGDIRNFVVSRERSLHNLNGTL